MAISDRRLMGADPLGRARALLLALGPRGALQLREKDLPARTLFAWVEALLPAAQASGARLLVNGRADLARCFSPALGLHLGGEAIPVAAARRLLGPDPWITAAAHDRPAAERAHAEGADAILLSPIYTSPGKGPPLGLPALAELCRALPCPVYALGGVDEGREAEVLSAGAAGWAGIRAFWEAARAR